MDQSIPSPKEFMKRLRPEQFSDSGIVKKTELSSTLLEYHLDTLTSRNQDREFETFAIKLAQFEICPNLLLQTGPSGGGDGKVDSENFPVSELTQLTYYSGEPNTTNERWAIAISATRGWREKLKRDVASILSTQRNYSRIFFITNQFVSAKKKSEVQDEYAKDQKLDLTILDRTWIIDMVFRNKRENLAIDELKMGISLKEEVTIGPNDLDRTQRFELLNKDVEEFIATGRYSINLIIDSLEVAIIGRNLEKPITQLFGLFDRAINIASKFGTIEQVFDAKYEKAWTSFFWLEDFGTFKILFEEIEEIGKDTENIFTAERLSTLFRLLTIVNKEEPNLKIDLKKHKQNLEKILIKFEQSDNKPNASLQARAIRLEIELTENFTDQIKSTQILLELEDVLHKSENLIGFSFDSITTLIQEMGDAFTDNEQYEKIILVISELDQKRKGEIPAAKALLKYGTQLLERGKLYKSIDFIGRSLIGLYKQESKQSFKHALQLIAAAYEKAGLFWAARGALVNSASYATQDFEKYNDPSELDNNIFLNLKRIEHRLGRIGYSLEWHNLDMSIQYNLNRANIEDEELLKRANHFDHILSLLLIKTPIENLDILDRLPSLLFNFNLEFSANAVLYLLTGKADLSKDFKEAFKSDEEIDSFFIALVSQKAQADLARIPDFEDGKNLSLTSSVLGMEIVIECENSSPGVELAESALASIESFLGTLLRYNAVGRAERITIKLLQKEKADPLINLIPQAEIGQPLTIEFGDFNAHSLDLASQSLLNKVIYELIVNILGRHVIFDDMEQTLNQLNEGEKVMQRSLNFLSTITMIGNVLGHNPKRRIQDWLIDDLKSYRFDKNPNRLKFREKGINGKEQEKYPKQTDEEITHKQIKTLSLIDDELWVKARWGGIGIMVYPKESKHPPVMLMMFWNGDLAKEIFRSWKKNYGEQLTDSFSISIIRGVNNKNPHWYSLALIPKIKDLSEGQRYTIVSRCTTMTASTSVNVEAFIKAFNEHKRFLLLAAKGGEGLGQPEIFDEVQFLISEIKVLHAWEVGINDLERTAIGLDGLPYIPEDRKLDAPVLKVLEEKLNRSKSQ